MTASIAPVSEVCRRPLSSTIFDGSSPVSSISSNTSLASRPDSVPSAISPRSSAPCAGETGLSSMSLPSWFNAPKRYEIRQLEKDRKSAEKGKSGEGRVVLGGREIDKKKKSN